MWWTIITGAMASATALLIAFGTYRWHKQQDRRLQLQLEKCKAYDEAQNARDGGTEVLRSADPLRFSMEKHKTSLACYGTPEVLEQCYCYAGCIDIYWSHLSKELNDRRLSRLAAGVESLSAAHAFLHAARMCAIVLSRSDALGISAEQSRSDLQGIFGSDE